MLLKYCIFAGIILSLTACSRVPIASNHIVSLQKKAKSAHHWDVLADDVSSQIFQAISSNSIKVNKKLTIDPPKTESTFNRAFTNFMINGLVNNGLIVTKDKADTTAISFETHLVKHNSSRHTHIPGSYTFLANGLWVLRNASDYAQYILPPMAIDAIMTFYAGPQTPIELIVTTSIYENNRFVFRRSDLYYIETEDVNLFREYIDLKPKTVEVTDR